MARHELTADHHYLLGCSGGVDSMVMADLLLQLKLSFALVHCNFQLRGEESKLDEKFVADFANANKLPLHTRRFETKEYARQNKLSTQLAARALRYEYFERLLSENPKRRMILGHHADDSLETIIVNLGRGCGLMPLSGINPARELYYRPLWLTPRKEILNYAKHHNIAWREDCSNHSDDYLRNHIRHHVIPPLKKAFNDLDQSFLTTLQNSNSDRALFDSLIEARLRSVIQKNETEERFPLNHINTHPQEFSLIYHWLKDKGNFDMQAIEKTIRQGESGKVFESGKAKLLLDREYLIFRINSIPDAALYRIEEGASSITSPLRMSFALKTGMRDFKSLNQMQACMDYDKLTFPLTLRHWREGDKFVPLGMKGSKKLSDFFVDHKLSRFDKEDLWLLCSGEEICWVVGYRMDDRFKLTDKTKNVYFAQVITNDED